MNTMDELLEKMTDDGYDVGIQKKELDRYRKAIKEGPEIIAERKCDELCAVVRMLLSLEIANGRDAWKIMENLKEEVGK